MTSTQSDRQFDLILGPPFCDDESGKFQTVGNSSATIGRRGGVNRGGIVRARGGLTELTARDRSGRIGRIGSGERPGGELLPMVEGHRLSGPVLLAPEVAQERADEGWGAVA